MQKWTDLPRKSTAKLKEQLEQGLTCTIDGCDHLLTNRTGEGQNLLCKAHQKYLRRFGGMGRLDRPHTFQRTWECSCCGYNALEDPRLQDIEDEMTKRRVARTLMHGDHSQVRKADGGDDSADNIVSLCFVCHAKKTILNEDYLK